jgi:outer membrane protein insertion porin family
MDETHNNGYEVKVDTEIAGLGGLGGNANFVKNSVEATLRVPFHQDWQVGLGLRCGFLMPFAWQPTVRPDVPAGARHTIPAQSHICDRFYLGGPNDVRGFRPRGLGPMSQTDALGGDAFWAAGLNVYSPFPYKPIRDRVPLQLHGFANAGSLCAINAASRSSITSIYRDLTWEPSASVGFGLAWRDRAFTAELNYCLPLRYGPSDMPQRGLQFGIGFGFL